MSEIQVSRVLPDFQDLANQLANVLSNTDTWRDRLTSSTGQTLVELISAIGAYDQYAIESGLQEAFPVSAKNDSSLYAIASMLGVRIARKSPAAISVSMSVAAGTLVIPPYSQFSGAGSVWFNRTAISLTTSPATFTLYQGQVIVTTINGLGTDFQAFVSQEQGFTVSNTDVLVSMNNVQIPLLTSGLWNAKGTAGVQDATLPDGRLILLFGNLLYGTKPSVSDVVVITYVQTSGADGNQPVVNGQRLTYLSNTSVTVVGTSDPTGGASEPSAILFKSIAAPLFGAFGAAVTKRQYVSTVQGYPGVIDGITFAQREINPGSLKWMNVIKIILLTSSSWTDAQKQTFIDTVQDNTMYAPRVILEDPQPQTVNLQLRIFCKNTAPSLTQVQTDVANAMTSLFLPRPGYLGFDIHLADIISVAEQANTNIDYVILDSPTAPVITSNNPMPAPTVVESSAGGTLVPGTSYVYGVSYSNAYGNVIPLNFVSHVLGGGKNRITVSWSAQTGATGYFVWGRTTGFSAGLLASLGSGVFSWVDDGSVTAAPPVLAETTSPIRYATLSPTPTISVEYSKRDSGRSS